MTATLPAVAAELGDRVISGPGTSGGPSVEDVEHDSRRVGPASLFACIRGATADGHDHAPAAIEAGAVALLTERPLDLGVPEIVVDDVRRSVGPAAAAVHDHPSDALAVVGVTGTNGKTTTVRIVAGIVDALGGRCREVGTLTGERTTPEAPELQRILSEARSRGDDVVAMEVSSHAVDQHRIDGTRFRVVAFTNLGVDHLDHHGTIERYFAAKAALFRPELADRAVIDVSTPHGRRLADSVSIPVVEVGDDIEILELGATAGRFRWRGHEVRVPLAGSFNVANSAVAAEIAVALGHQPEDVAAALAAIEPVPGRFETIDVGQPFTVIVDYAHTPDGLEAVLETARAITERQLVVVFGAGGDRDREKRPRMGDVARRGADRVVVTSDNPRSERPESIISAIVSGMSAPPDLIEVDRRTAIRHAIAGARSGDVVVIAGKGHETTQTIGPDSHPFDDRIVAREEIVGQRDRSS